MINDRLEDISFDCLEFLAKNICQDVEILDLSYLSFVDNHFDILLSRCKKIKELSLWRINLTNNSLKIILENLGQTLEKLSLDYSEEIWFTGFLELKSMPRLEIVSFKDEKNEDIDEAIDKLRKQLPHLEIYIFL